MIMANNKKPTVAKNKKSVTPPTPHEEIAPQETKKLTKFKVVANLHISEEVVAENFKEAYEKLSDMKLRKFLNFQNTSVIG